MQATDLDDDKMVLHIDDASPLLTILIPTFNRSRFLTSALSNLCNQVGSLPIGSVEIVIADNKSSDNTMEVVASFASKFSFVRYYEQPVHYDSAERNIFSSLEVCRGRYVWTVSDDDKISFEGAKTILEHLIKYKYDFMLLNVSLYDTKGRLRAFHYIPPNVFRDIEKEVDLDIIDIIEMTGLIGLITSISSAVFRREHVLAVDWLGMIEKSAIYSHSAIYATAFRHKRCAFISAPLVHVFDEEGIALEKIAHVARRNGHFRFYYWTVGLSRLVGELDLDVGRIWEVGPFHRIPLGDMIIGIMCDQLQHCISSNKRSEAFTDFEVGQIYNAICSTSTIRYHMMLNQLERLGLLIRPFLPDGRSLSIKKSLACLPEEAQRNFESKTIEYVMLGLSEIKAALKNESLAVEHDQYKGYRVVRWGEHWIAQTADIDLPEYSLEKLEDSAPHRLVSNSRERLLRKIDAALGSRSANQLRLETSGL